MKENLISTATSFVATSVLLGLIFVPRPDFDWSIGDTPILERPPFVNPPVFGPPPGIIIVER